MGIWGWIIGRKLKEKIDKDIKKDKKSKKHDEPIIDLKEDSDTKPPIPSQEKI